MRMVLVNFVVCRDYKFCEVVRQIFIISANKQQDRFKTGFKTAVWTGQETGVLFFYTAANSQCFPLRWYILSPGICFGALTGLKINKMVLSMW